jgi:hypothetical protein
MKRLLLLLVVGCSAPVREQKPVYAHQGACVTPTQLSSLSGAMTTNGLVASKRMQRCNWQWYGGLANGGYVLISVDTVTAPSNMVLY